MSDIFFHLKAVCLAVSKIISYTLTTFYFRKNATDMKKLYSHITNSVEMFATFYFRKIYSNILGTPACNFCGSYAKFALCIT